MLIGPKLAEYVIAGAFFWLGQIAIACLVSAITHSRLIGNAFLGYISKITSNTPSLVHQPIIALSTVVALIAVVFTGLIIELFRGSFQRYDMAIFSKYIRVNDSWLSRLVARNNEATPQDYSDLRDRLVYTSIVKRRKPGTKMNQFFIKLLDNEMLEGLARLILLHYPHLFGSNPRQFLLRRSLARSRRQKNWHSKLSTSYRRLHSILLAYILTHPRVGELDALDERLQLSKTTRSLAMTAWFLLYETGAVVFVLLLWNRTIKFATGTIFVFLFSFLAVDVITKILSTQAHERYCDLLFQLAYMANSEDEAKAGNS